MHPLPKQWVLGLALSFLASCSAGSPPPAPEYTAAAPKCDDSDQQQGYGLQDWSDFYQDDATDEDSQSGGTEDDIPTFEDDILEMLGSTDDGRVYKCTVCHSRYTDPANVASEQSAKQILAAIKPGGNMPLNADKVVSADIAMFEKWMEAGFPLTQADIIPEKDDDDTAKEEWNDQDRSVGADQGQLSNRSTFNSSRCN